MPRTGRQRSSTPRPDGSDRRRRGPPHALPIRIARLEAMGFQTLNQLCEFPMFMQRQLGVCSPWCMDFRPYTL